jgi:hypothetical protein
MIAMRDAQASTTLLTNKTGPKLIPLHYRFITRPRPNLRSRRDLMRPCALESPQSAYVAAFTNPTICHQQEESIKSAQTIENSTILHLHVQ